MKGEKIAELLVEWANKQRLHQDDFSDLFVEELIDLLNEDTEES